MRYRSDSPFGSPAPTFRGKQAMNGEGQTGWASFHARLEEPRIKTEKGTENGDEDNEH